MPGKVGYDDLDAVVFERTGASDSAVLQGPAIGEDAAAIECPGGTLVVSTDSISLAASKVGTLGVPIACNDVAASGGDPRWLTVMIGLPAGAEHLLDTITSDLDDAARDIGVSIVGGHSEYVDVLDRPLLSLTAMGLAETFVPTGGATVGDSVLLTNAAAIEGTAILAADFGAELGVESAVLARAESYLDELHVLPDARIVREYATAMHDPTEGGVAAGLLELAIAASVRLEIDRDAIPVREETAILCEAAGVDPLRIFGSGALLATVPEEREAACVAALEAADRSVAVIGTVTDSVSDGELVLDGEPVHRPVEDDLYPLWAAADE